MFGVDSGELMLIVLVAVVVIGPKDLPRVMRTVGHWVGKARGMANQFRSGVDQMVRESEIADLEQKWREQNEAIMKANPMAPEPLNFAPAPPVEEPADSGWGLPVPGESDQAAVMKPLAREAPMPPASGAASQPTPPRLDKVSPAPAPPTPDLAQPAASGRRPPRTAPSVNL